jgi:hypothetical protein
MTSSKLAAIVSEAVSLDRDIAGATDRLKELKKILRTEAESRSDEARPTEHGGASIEFHDDLGNIARVTFPAPSLKDEIPAEGKLIERIKFAAGKLFDQLFRPVIAYRPIDGFRAAAEQLLERKTAKGLIDLCEKESAPRVAFETKLPS